MAKQGIKQKQNKTKKNQLNNATIKTNETDQYSLNAKKDSGITES